MGGRAVMERGPQVSAGRGCAGVTHSGEHREGHHTYMATRVRGQTMALVTLGFKNRAGRVKSGSQVPRETRTEQNHGQRLLSLC